MRVVTCCMCKSVHSPYEKQAHCKGGCKSATRDATLQRRTAWLKRLPCGVCAAHLISVVQHQQPHVQHQQPQRRCMGALIQPLASDSNRQRCNAPQFRASRHLTQACCALAAVQFIESRQSNSAAMLLRDRCMRCALRSSAWRLHRLLLRQNNAVRACCSCGQQASAL